MSRARKLKRVLRGEREATNFERGDGAGVIAFGGVAVLEAYCICTHFSQTVCCLRREVLRAYIYLTIGRVQATSTSFTST
jgi:hypothetical protein